MHLRLDLGGLQEPHGLWRYSHIKPGCHRDIRPANHHGNKEHWRQEGPTTSQVGGPGVIHPSSKLLPVMCFRRELQQTGNPRWDPVLRARLQATCQGLCPQIILSSVTENAPPSPLLPRGPLIRVSSSPTGSPQHLGNSCQLVSSPLVSSI